MEALTGEYPLDFRIFKAFWTNYTQRIPVYKNWTITDFDNYLKGNVNSVIEESI
jgi:hypothetical protein